MKWAPGISGNFVVKSKLPPRSGCSLEAVEPHPKKVAIKFFFFIYKSAKVKSSKDKLGTAFHHKGLPAEETPLTAHLIILVDSVYRRSKSYYSQVILEECKYMVKNETSFSF